MERNAQFTILQTFLQIESTLYSHNLNEPQHPRFILVPERHIYATNPSLHAPVRPPRCRSLYFPTNASHPTLRKPGFLVRSTAYIYTWTKVREKRLSVAREKFHKLAVLTPLSPRASSGIAAPDSRNRSPAKQSPPRPASDPRAQHASKYPPPNDAQSFRNPADLE